jgi:hypothetical protein
MPMASKSARRPWWAYHFAQVRLHRIFTDRLTFSDTSRLITNGPAISPINEVSAAITARSVRY